VRRVSALLPFLTAFPLYPQKESLRQYLPLPWHDDEDSDYAHGGFRYHCRPSRYPHTRS
jgi:hypothetical protein